MLILTDFLNHAEALLAALRQAVADAERVKAEKAALEAELRIVLAELDLARTELRSHGG